MAKSYKSSFMACYGKPNPNMDKIIYICWQEEVCPKTGRHHWQTFVRFKSKNSVLALQKAIGIDQTLKYTDENGVDHFAWKCHIKPHAAGTESTCIEYCRKKESAIEGTFEEHGAIPKREPGKRTDLENAVMAIRAGELPDDKVILRYPAGVKAMQAIVNKENTLERNKYRIPVGVLWGGAGTGKTRAVIDTFGQENVYSLTKSKNEVWFDGYNNEKILIIDDFYGWIEWPMLLKILDRYQLRLNIKGSYTWANWEQVFITSNAPYHEWYSDIKDTYSLERRITNLRYFPPLPEENRHKPVVCDNNEDFFNLHKSIMIKDREPIIDIPIETTHDEFNPYTIL